jgi:hypothetical protein
MTACRVDIPSVPTSAPVASVEQVSDMPNTGQDDDCQDTPGDQAPVSKQYQTAKNPFGVYRVYHQRPQRIPDTEVDLSTLCTDAVLAAAQPPKPPPPPPETPSLEEAIHPFPNTSTYLLSRWHAELPHGGLSHAGLQKLLDDVLLSKDFNLEHLQGVKIAAVNRDLDALDQEPDDDETDEGVLARLQKDGWKESQVRIRVPTGDKSADGRKWIDYDAEVLLHRSLTEVIKAAFRSPQSQRFHYEPFFAYHTQTSPDGSEFDERIYDELYASDAWMKEHIAVLNLDSDNLPRAIAALMFSSDATHVSQFGQSKMWPLYLFFGNLSKWFRCKPSTRSCHHVAHIPSVSFACYSYNRI